VSANAKLIKGGQLGGKKQGKKRSGSDNAFVGFPPSPKEQPFLAPRLRCAKLNAVPDIKVEKRELWLGQPLARYDTAID
jgi:hypothetical protein